MGLDGRVVHRRVGVHGRAYARRPVRRHLQFVFVLLVLGGCAGLNLSDLVPQSPREALVIAETTFDGSNNQLIALRNQGVIGDEAWKTVKVVVSDIRAAMRLARNAVRRGESPYAYLEAVNNGLAILRSRLMEADK